jgi:hypothetical protein
LSDEKVELGQGSSKYASNVWVSLELRGRELDPDIATTTLGVEPTRARRPNSPSGGNPAGIWRLSTPGRSLEIEDHLRWLMKLLDAADWKHLWTASGVERIDVSCVWESALGRGGPALAADILEWFGSRGISLYIELTRGSQDD